MVRLLICSDDLLLAELIRSVLADLEVEIVLALDWDDLQRLTQRDRYELVLVVGVRLFRAGSLFLDRVRSHPCMRPELFVLAWQQSEQTVLSLLETGVDQYMTLPFHPARLRAKVIEAVGLACV